MNRVLFFGLLFLLILTCMGPKCHANEYLTPCYSSIMGIEGLDDYYRALNKKLFSKRNNSSLSNHIIKILILPSHEPEISISIFQNTRNNCTLEYRKARNSIWMSINNINAPKEAKIEMDYVSYDDIEVEVKEINLDQAICSNINTIVSVMTNTAKQPLDNAYKIPLDSTIYLFSSTPGVCGFASATQEVGKIRNLQEIVIRLIDLAKTENITNTIELERLISKSLIEIENKPGVTH